MVPPFWVRGLLGHAARPRRSSRPHRRLTHSAKLSLESLECRLAPANFTVMNLNNSGAGSLRQALADAAGGNDTIDFNPGLSGTINLGSELVAVKGVSITGPGADVIRISGQNSSRVFNLGASGSHDFSISKLSIINGKAGDGGAIDFSPTDGSLTIDGCVFDGNKATQSGGAIHVVGDGSAATSVTISNSTFSGNSAKSGGAMNLSNCQATVTNCTISGNSGSSSAGGALVVADGDDLLASATFTNCTFAQNTGSTANALLVAVLDDAKGASAKYLNTIFTGSGANIAVQGDEAKAVSLGHNLSEDGTGNLNQPGDLANTSALLAALDDYGGAAETLALLPGSPAINGGDAAGAPAADERGIARVGAVDIGAFESQGFTITITGGDHQQALVQKSFGKALEVKVASAFDEPVVGGKVTFAALGTGASATFTGNPDTIDNNGKASVTAKANDESGTYLVTASATGAAPVAFGLENLNGDPTATFSDNGPVNEGSTATVTFSGQTDSPADKNAGFHYAYDL